MVFPLLERTRCPSRYKSYRHLETSTLPYMVVLGQVSMQRVCMGCGGPARRGAPEPPAPTSAAPLGFAAPTAWSDTPCEASPWRVSNSALPPNGSSLATPPAHVR